MYQSRSYRFFRIACLLGAVSFLGIHSHVPAWMKGCMYTWLGCSSQAALHTIFLVLCSVSVTRWFNYVVWLLCFGSTRPLVLPYSYRTIVPELYVPCHYHEERSYTSHTWQTDWSSMDIQKMSAESVHQVNQALSTLLSYAHIDFADLTFCLHVLSSYTNSLVY